MSADKESSTKRIEWSNIPNDGLLDTFANLNNLDSQSIRMTSPGVLLLPNNQFLGDESRNKNLFAHTTKEILFKFKENGLEAGLYNDDKEKCELVLKSADIILPILLFLGTAPASVGLSILANWIYDRWIKSGGKQRTSISVEYAEISPERKIIRWKRIVGPVDEVKRLLNEESEALEKKGKNRSEVPIHDPIKQSDESWWINQCKESAKLAIKEANEIILEAENAINNNKREVAENLYRQSLMKIREAVLWEPEETDYSKYLHDVGHTIHDVIGCQLEFKDSCYWVTCPVLLAHSKGGFSIGGTGKSLCSICGENMLDCAHIKGNIYDKVRARFLYDICNICGQKKCEHQEGELFNGVRAFAYVAEMNINHISYVKNPANPLCVVHSYSIPEIDIIEMLPNDERDHFNYGQTVINCHHCEVCRQI